MGGRAGRIVGRGREMRERIDVETQRLKMMEPLTLRGREMRERIDVERS